MGTANHRPEQVVMTAEDLRSGMLIDTLRNVSYVEAIGCSTIRNLTFYVQ